MWKTLFTNDGLRSLFGLVLVSTILTIYELVLFYRVVVPQITTQVDNGLNLLANTLYTNFALNPSFKYLSQLDLSKDFNTNQTNEVRNIYNQITIAKEKKELTTNRILNALETFKEREKIYTHKINNYTKFVAVVILSVLTLILVSIYKLLKSRGETIGKCTWIVTFITIALILIFQYIFYIFGNKYQYIGSKGNEEMLVYIFDEL